MCKGIGCQLHEVVFVEGEFNAITLLNVGIKDVVGVPGANIKKAAWIETLDRLGDGLKKYIMYDNFTLNDHTTCHDDKVVNNASFPHPDCVRWELHRVWVVEATLKPGYRHIYGMSEGPYALMASAYDGLGMAQQRDECREVLNEMKPKEATHA